MMKKIDHTNQVKNKSEVVERTVSDDGKTIRLVMGASPYEPYKDTVSKTRYYKNHKSIKYVAKRKARRKIKPKKLSDKVRRTINKRMKNILIDDKYGFKARFYVYVLQCEDNHYYVGTTTNVARRFGEHKSGKNGAAYTKRHKPLKVVETIDLGVVEYRQALLAENEKTIEVILEHPGKATGGVAAELGWVH